MSNHIVNVKIKVGEVDVLKDDVLLRGKGTDTFQEFSISVITKCKNRNSISPDYRDYNFDEEPVVHVTCAPCVRR